jgi:hypothetical protein
VILLLFFVFLQVLAEWAYMCAISLVILIAAYIMFKRYLLLAINTPNFGEIILDSAILKSIFFLYILLATQPMLFWN